MNRGWRSLGILLLVVAILWFLTVALRGAGDDDASARGNWGSARPSPTAPASPTGDPTGYPTGDPTGNPTDAAESGAGAPRRSAHSGGIFAPIDEAARRREAAENGGAGDRSPSGSARSASGDAPAPRPSSERRGPGDGQTGTTNRNATVAGSAQGSAVPADAERIMLILDASGSMARVGPDGRTSMEAAQEAMADAVQRVPQGTQVGLRVFGSRVDGKGRPTPRACRDTRLVQPLAELDHRRMTTAIFSFDPLGETPIARSLRAAVDDLGDEGRRAILLVSDGEESCDPDPCEAVTQARSAGVDVRVHTVGLRVQGRARDQLRCIARSSGGSYGEAGDEYQLTSALRSAMERVRSSDGAGGTDTRGTRDAASASAQQTAAADDGYSLGNREAAGAILIVLLMLFFSSDSRRRR